MGRSLLNVKKDSTVSENLGSLIGAGTALEDIVNEHKKKETRTTDRSKILWFIYFEYFFVCK